MFFKIIGAGNKPMVGVTVAVVVAVQEVATDGKFYEDESIEFNYIE